jgi:hypothetical protein
MQPVLLQIQTLGGNVAGKQEIDWSQLRLNNPKINGKAKLFLLLI